MVLKSKHGIGIVDQSYYALDLVLDLLRRHEDMRVVLCKAAHTHETMKLAGFLMTVYQTQLAHTQGQVTVGTGLCRVNQNAARAIHRFDRVILAVDDGGVHVILIVIPVSGGLPQASVQDNRGRYLHVAGLLVDLSPVVDQGIL